MKRALLVRRLGLGALALLALAVLGYVALRAGPLAPTRITVTQVHVGTLQPSVFGIGTVEARRAWMIGPTVAGRLLSVRVDVGDVVRAGQLLAEMDPVDIDERLKALDASVARAGSTQAAAQAQVADATARRELAALAQQRGNLRLVAPAEGVVTSRDAEAGSTVLAGQAVVRLIDPASLWVKLRVDQGRSGGLVTGLVARIALRSQPAAPLAGRVVRVERVADNVTEARIALVAFDMPVAGTAFTASVGEQAEVTLQLGRTAPALLVPNACLQRAQGQDGVWRIHDGRPQWAPVRPGALSLDGQVQVLGGLQSGDSIVVYSQKALTAGARVQVVDALVKSDAAGSPP